MIDKALDKGLSDLPDDIRKDSPTFIDVMIARKKAYFYRSGVPSFLLSWKTGAKTFTSPSSRPWTIHPSRKVLSRSERNLGIRASYGHIPVDGGGPRPPRALEGVGHVTSSELARARGLRGLAGSGSLGSSNGRAQEVRPLGDLGLIVGMLGHQVGNPLVEQVEPLAENADDRQGQHFEARGFARRSRSCTGRSVSTSGCRSWHGPRWSTGWAGKTRSSRRRSGRSGSSGLPAGPPGEQALDHDCPSTTKPRRLFGDPCLSTIAPEDARSSSNASSTAHTRVRIDFGQQRRGQEPFGGVGLDHRPFSS